MDSKPVLGTLNVEWDHVYMVTNSFTHRGNLESLHASGRWEDIRELRGNLQGHRKDV